MKGCEKMNIRVLSFRKHKYITFVNGYCDEFGTEQFMVENKLFQSINCGDLIKANFVIEKNNKGQFIKKIITIDEIVKSTNFISGKSINGIKNTKEKNLIEARNAGLPLKYLQLKQELLLSIRKILDANFYYDVTGLINTVENYSNGSNINEMKIQSKYDGVKYLRISFENQLKQISALLLKSVYSIDKVFRDMGEDSTHINEFLMFELVDLSNDIDKITKLIIKFDELSKKMCDKYGLGIKEKKLDVIDYTELRKYGKENLLNTLVINYPCDSPFIKKDLNEDLRKEVRWYMNGHWIAHYYHDENNFENVKDILQLQQDNSMKENINTLDYFSWGLPSSVSLGLSIDRWLQMVLDVENLYTIADPLSLGYSERKLVKNK